MWRRIPVVGQIKGFLSFSNTQRVYSLNTLTVYTYNRTLNGQLSSVLFHCEKAASLKRDSLPEYWTQCCNTSLTKNIAFLLKYINRSTALTEEKEVCAVGRQFLLIPKRKYTVQGVLCSFPRVQKPTKYRMFPFHLNQACYFYYGRPLSKINRVIKKTMPNPSPV